MYQSNYLALRISYLEHQLKSICHGYFGTKNGVPVVYVTWDPSKSKITGHNYRNYHRDSPKGKIYSEQVNQYQKISSELKHLRSYTQTYSKSNSSGFLFPIVQKSDYNDMDFKKFSEAEPYQNKMECKTLHKLDNDVFRSKNELLVAKVLRELRIPFKVEPRLLLKTSAFDSEIVYPDFIIGHEAANKSQYIEVLGGFGLNGYDERAIRKIRTYQNNGYRDMYDVIFLFLSDNIDEFYIRTKLLSAFELIVPRPD